MKRSPTLKLMQQRVQGIVDFEVGHSFRERVTRSLTVSRRRVRRKTYERKIGGGRPGCKSSWGYYLLVSWKASSRREPPRGEVERGGSVKRKRVEGERGCMQTAVRGGHLTPFIHPSLVKPSDARGIGCSFLGFDGVFEAKGVEIAGRTRAVGTGVQPVRQCDPELAASRSIPGSLSYPPTPSASLPINLLFSSRRLRASSDPSRRGAP